MEYSKKCILININLILYLFSKKVTQCGYELVYRHVIRLSFFHQTERKLENANLGDEVALARKRGRRRRPGLRSTMALNS